MGDVGSGLLGFAIGVLTLASQAGGGPPVWSWMILVGLFVVDATLTLAVRVTRGDRWYQAHRTHAYQRLTRRWASHRRVTISALVVNLLWLLPWAVFAWQSPGHGWWVVLLALLPVAWVVAAVGAGTGTVEQEVARVS
jgi:Fuc2NAc and GlcNAc transferase